MTRSVNPPEGRPIRQPDEYPAPRMVTLRRFAAKKSHMVVSVPVWRAYPPPPTTFVIFGTLFAVLASCIVLGLGLTWGHW